MKQLKSVRTSECHIIGETIQLEFTFNGEKYGVAFRKDEKMTDVADMLHAFARRLEREA